MKAESIRPHQQLSLRNLSLKQLSYLVALYEAQHFSIAAKHCYVSQSTLSSGIQNLEDLLNCQLIERDNRTLAFTAIGEEVVLRSRDILNRTQDLIDYTVQAKDPMQGIIRLGCIPTIAPFLLGKLVQQINKQYPLLNLLVREDTTANLIEAIKNGQLDLLILALPVDIGNMPSKIVGRDPFKFVIAKQHLVHLTMPLDYQQLPDHFLYLLDREHCLTEHALSACKMVSTIKINPFTATSIHTLVSMVANGLGATFVPKMAIDHGLLSHLDLEIIDPPEPLAYREIGIVWRPTSSRISTYYQLASLLESLLKT